ncbi:MAG TPA: multicopper oxidase family protein [Candidatus Lumbricidophila sp.]|nr:multicopper oxidase family protein [Candidatus Lumbricidophila sp.]
MNSYQNPLQLPLTRRGFIGVGVGALALAGLSACTPPTANFVQPGSAEVTEVERRRRGTGHVTTTTLTAAPTLFDLAGATASTWAFGAVPPVIRIGAGDTLQAKVRNQLNTDTSVHWHGVALRNDMDGVPPLTQQPIKSGGEFTYEFTAPDAGTYWFHPHVGVQADRGLYGALIVEDPAELGQYDDEWVIMLDDWLDGVTATPDQVLRELSAGMHGMGGMHHDSAMRMGNLLMGAKSELLGGDAGDVYYPTYLINGKPSADPAQFTARPGHRIRLRIINAGGDTAFRFGISGHTLTITHSDGFAVNPTVVDSILIGMGERFDAVVTLGDGVFPMVAEAEGKTDRAVAIVRTNGSSRAPTGAAVSRLAAGRVGFGTQLRASDDVALPDRRPDRQLALAFTGGMGRFNWGVNGRHFDMHHPMDHAFQVKSGERVRLTVSNDTAMWHPFHLHGHTYQHASGGARKDTSIILPRQKLVVEFEANNPGVWAAHCHNTYHAEAGMMAVVGYLR